MAAPQVLLLRPENKRGRPYRSIETLVERISKDTGKEIILLNDRLIKVDGKYFFLQDSIYWSLRGSLLRLVEATVIGAAIIGHMIWNMWRDDDELLDRENIKLSFVFDKNGDFLDHSQMTKLGILGITNKYKCFRHDDKSI